MRRGEIAGLRESSIDIERNIVLVNESRAYCKGNVFQKSTKTEHIRQVPLNDLALQALWIARKQRAQWSARAGALWQNSGHVFVDEIGHPLNPNALTDSFRRVFEKLEKAGVPHKRLHDLRHTAGTLMLAAGTDLNTVQAILGHSVASTTLNTYGHVLNGQKESGIRRIDAALIDDETA